MDVEEHQAMDVDEGLDSSEDSSTSDEEAMGAPDPDPDQQEAPVDGHMQDSDNDHDDDDANRPDDEGMASDSSSDGDESAPLDEENDAQPDEEGANGAEPSEPQQSTAMRDQFQEYTDHCFSHFKELEPYQVHMIKIMHTLAKKKATMDTYDAVMEWHLRTTGKLKEYQALGDSKDYWSRKKLMQFLKKRNNMTEKYAKPRKTVLRGNKAKVTMQLRHARELIQSIFTDPRLKSEDWLWHNKDVFALAQDNLNYIGDINTGKAYLKTYKELITDPSKQILVPLPLYIDGAVTGQFDKLQVECLKMTNGLLTNKARQREYVWKTLGLMPNYTKADSRGKKLFVESGHLAALDLFGAPMHQNDEEGANNSAEDQDPAHGMVEYHHCLEIMLESLHELIEEGMVLDLMINGHLIKNVELVFFVPYVKCDGDEADKLTLSYRSRGKGVSQLCRYCQCPAVDSDNVDANYPKKTEPMMKKLFEQQNNSRLKQLSQVNAKNAFHGLRMGLHNNRGIHGATPWDMLHTILLGVFLYARDCFFAQIGWKSKTSDEINSMAKMIGRLLARQSDRDKPRTKFAKGIKKGKIMAKEFTGVLLLMSAILRSDMGRDVLQKAFKKNFRHDWQLKDWALLVESLLEWEEYLKSDTMLKQHVQKLKHKHRFLMYLLKKIGARSKGMGFKTMKFHSLTHLAEDIENFGVPQTLDTGELKLDAIAADGVGFGKSCAQRNTMLACHRVPYCPGWYQNFHRHSKLLPKLTKQCPNAKKLGMNRMEMLGVHVHLVRMLRTQMRNIGIGSSVVRQSFVQANKIISTCCSRLANANQISFLCTLLVIGSNESHHKTTKVAAKLTQKDITTFEKQVSDRLDDLHTLDLAIEEINGRPLRSYLEGYDHNTAKRHPGQITERHDEDESVMEEVEERPKTSVGGLQLEVFKDDETGSLQFKVVTRTKYKDLIVVMPEVMEVVWKIQELVQNWIKQVRLCAEHKRNGVIFRSHPCYLGKGPWRDWVLVDWGEDGQFPAQIWGFVDLTDLPQDVELTLDIGEEEIRPELSKNIFAIVESATPYVEKSPKSDIWRPITLDTVDTADGVKRYFYVVDVDTFVSPICVIANLGGPIDEFLWMKARKEWREDFIEWLEAPVGEDRDQMEEIEEEENSEQSESEDEDDEDDEDEEDGESEVEEEGPED